MPPIKFNLPRVNASIYPANSNYYVGRKLECLDVYSVEKEYTYLIETYIFLYLPSSTLLVHPILEKAT